MNAPTSAAVSACPKCGYARLLGARYCIRCGTTFAQASSETASARAPRRLSRRVSLRGANSDLLYVIVAAILAVVLSYLPVINVVVYPFKLFAAFVHEWFHAL